MSRMTIVCDTCGSIYEFTSQKAIMRVKEDFNCDECDAIIYKCNEAKDWSYKLVERKNNHMKENKGDGFFGNITGKL